jgi:hypothetical protein
MKTSKELFIGLLGSFLAFGLTLTGCTTVAPVSMQATQSLKDKAFTMLGPVSCTVSSKDKAGVYNELIETARRQYPDCDYVIDVTADMKMTKFFGWVTSVTYMLHGVAIQYDRETGKARPAPKPKTQGTPLPQAQPATPTQSDTDDSSEPPPFPE